ncbi:hypothetical protein A3D09_01390 [Candidatus Collierbacteria bacterium RIFCSPHIGHO2_02_FULL_49_10]|uniref:Uncharacterized protein n=2 Tax=Candidatus Collieribacteriota TaxID=1752725 RepID=A0A1F5EV57_9BACT|nr:MAG: hypothetical protein A3D09_01390 [Candidatus Collierbacteria bacterium RIFCSPHIGHO2_02_FULL_49_10]OGD71485.1 MAG: hypothetical protein A2703_03090 [Candidatus Collierbacteria bacterium RIFCSPHIGHO2_01_FULL_50_25]
MGFYEDVVPQVFDGKISTWRLRDHGFRVGDKVLFENTQTGKVFGTGKITGVTKTTAGKINLKDKRHYKTYKNRRELIRAFKKRNPAYKVNNSTRVFVYTYKFTPRKTLTTKI